MIISAAKSYAKHSFSVEKSMNSYRHGVLSNMANSIKWTKNFERRFWRVKTYGKFFLQMYISHLVTLNMKFSFMKYSLYGTFNDTIVEILEKNKELEKNE